MRARMAILLSGQAVSIRAIVLKDKPADMLIASPKGTVPVLVFDDGSVIDESYDIMLWALQSSDPRNLLYNDEAGALAQMLTLIQRADDEFKTQLEQYKQAKRYHEDNKEELRQRCEVFVADIEHRLSLNPYLFGATISLADIAILPFLRQFARVDRQWYLQAPYPHLQHWLKQQLNSRAFSKTMKDFPLWLENGEEFLLKL
jgi:glutathione S-transferase